jgi:hypothetical protein
VNSSSFGWLARTLLAAVVLTATKAQAATITFEDLTGPSFFAEVVPKAPQHLDHYTNVGGQGVDAVFDGGAILDNTQLQVGVDANGDPILIPLPANSTSIYGTAFLGEDNGPFFPDALTITFSQPVSNLFFDVINGWGEPISYRVEDNAGHFDEFTLLSTFAGGQTRVFFPMAGDTVTIRPLTFGAFGEYDFFVDNVQFNEPVPEPATLVLLGSGLASAALARRRRRHTSAK